MAPRRDDPPTRYRATVLIVGGVLGMFLSACSPRQPDVLQREELFTLEIGRLEDQLDVITRDGVMPRAETSLTMRDGLVYIGDGAANKLMEFTSFGDLVRLIYNPQQNPEPVTLSRDPSDGDGERTRVASPYSFGRLGNVAVDSRRYVYGEDRLPPERSVFDADLGVQLNRIVVRFDDAGRALDYLGQEGIGGTPFPYIRRLQVTERDEVVVVSATTDARFVYLYDPSGELIYTVRIGLDRLPVPSADSDAIAVLEELVSGVDQYRIYLKISYYRTAVATDTGEESGISFDHSRIYWLDLETGRYEGFVELPRGTSGESALHYEMIGVSGGERMYLLSREDVGRTRLIIMNDAGRVVRRRTLQIPETNLVFRRFDVTPEGVLTSLLGFEDRAEIVWWRTDRLLSNQRSAPEDIENER